jgi:Flp pilus assembly protein TadD
MPDVDLNAILEQARQHHREGRLAEAERAYRQVLERDANQPEALMGMGVVAFQCGAAEQALPLMERAVALRPGVMHFYMNLGEVLRRLMRLEDALAAYQRALELNPRSAEAHYCMGLVQEKTGQMDQAAALYREATRLRPDFPEAHMNLGVALERQGRYEQSLAQLEEAIRLRGDYALARMNRAVALLRLGDYRQGWQEYEWRFGVRDFALPATQPPRPVWDGSEPAGRTILVRAEQGMGDTLQFARYIPLLIARGARVFLETQPPLKPLLAGIYGLSGATVQGEAPPPHDVQIAMMSLPRIFGTELATVPALVPYLTPDPARVSAWSGRFAGETGLKVGLVWAGNPGFPGDALRSLDFAVYAPLAQAPGVVFYSLQKGEAAAQAKNPPPGMRLIDLGPDLNDFADTAAALAHLDLLISVDTSIVHLAGAMARPVWTLVPFVPDFRWLLKREDSPWYPTMRLFRQGSANDWAGVIGRIAEALKEYKR